jgi:acid-sensing ion channel, other
VSQQKKPSNRLDDYIQLSSRTKNKNIRKLFEHDKKRSLRFFLNSTSKVYLHATEEVTSFDVFPQFISRKLDFIDLLVIFRETFTTKDVRALSMAQRKCIFHDEVDLKYFEQEVYSSSTCMLRCRMRTANDLCGCIPPFYLPATGSFRGCSTRGDLECLKKNVNNITSTRNCGSCLLKCSSIVYESDKLKQE